MGTKVGIRAFSAALALLAGCCLLGAFGPEVRLHEAGRPAGRHLLQKDGSQLAEVHEESKGEGNSVVTPVGEKSQHHVKESDNGESQVEGHGETLAEEKELEKEEEEELVEESERLQFTIAMLVCFFIAGYVFLLYLVNYPDGNVRSYIYKMLSSTMSIFLAVTINMACFSFVLEQILPSPWHTKSGIPRGFGLEVTELTEFIVGMCYFSFFFFLLNVLGYRFREKKKALYAVRVIGGHLAAFAGITTFGTMQLAAHHDQDGFFGGHHGMVIAFTVVVLLVVRGLAMFIRNRAYGSYASASEKAKAGYNAASVDPTGSASCTPNPSQALAQQEKWRTEVCEAEDDATSLIMAFMCCQVIVWKISGHFIPLHHASHHRRLHEVAKAEKVCQHTMAEAEQMAMWTLYSIALLVVAMFVRRSIPNITVGHETQSDPNGWARRCKAGFQTFAAMLMSWNLLRMGSWMTEVHLRGTALGSESMTNIVNAFLLSFLAVVVVLCLDFFADRAHTLEGASPTNDKLKRKDSQMGNAINAGDGLSGAETLEVFQKTWMSLQAASTDVSNLERALRTIIDSFGLLVGLCWEKATDAAIETIIEGNVHLSHHLVISKLGAAIMVIIVIFPAWRYFIIPKAEMTEKDHEAMIELQQMQENSGSDDHQKHPLGSLPQDQLFMTICKDIQAKRLKDLYEMVIEEKRL